MDGRLPRAGNRTRRQNPAYRPAHPPLSARSRATIAAGASVARREFGVVVGRLVLGSGNGRAADDDGALGEHVVERVSLCDEVVRVVLDEVLLFLPEDESWRED